MGALERESSRRNAARKGRKSRVSKGARHSSQSKTEPHRHLGHTLSFLEHGLERCEEVVAADVFRNDEQAIYVITWSMHAQSIRAESENLATGRAGDGVRHAACF